MWGARKVMYLVLGSSWVLALLLSVPRMEITSPGKGVVATKNRASLIPAPTGGTGPRAARFPAALAATCLAEGTM